MRDHYKGFDDLAVDCKLHGVALARDHGIHEVIHDLISGQLNWALAKRDNLAPDRFRYCVRRLLKTWVVPGSGKLPEHVKKSQSHMVSLILKPHSQHVMKSVILRCTHWDWTVEGKIEVLIPNDPSIDVEKILRNVRANLEELICTCGDVEWNRSKWLGYEDAADSWFTLCVKSMCFDVVRVFVVMSGSGFGGHRKHSFLSTRVLVIEQLLRR